MTRDRTLETLILLAVITIPAFGVLYAYTEPGAFDPMAHRLGFSALGLVLILGIRRSARVRARTGELALLAATAFVAWFVWVAWRNGFPTSRVLGLLTIQFAGGLLLWRPLYNAVFNGMVLALAIGGMVATPHLEVDPRITIIAVACLALFGFWTALGRSTAHQQLEDRVRERTLELEREVCERRAADSAHNTRGSADPTPL